MSDRDDDLSDEEIDAIVQAAIGELLNIAACVAELQITDEAAEEIYSLCDLVAEYHGIERTEIIIEENQPQEPSSPAQEPSNDNEPPVPIPGSIRTRNRPKFRVSDVNKPRNEEE